MLLACLMLACSCDLLLPETVVVREINAAWAPDDSAILVVESEYRTKHPEEPHFNAVSAYDWKLRFRIDAPDLGHGAVAMEWGEETSQGGIPQYGHLYWLKDRSLVFYMDMNKPYLADLATRIRAPFVPPSSVIMPAFSPWPGILYDELIYFEAVPSPDGRFVALWVLGAYDVTPGAYIPDIRNQSAIALWRTVDRRWVSAIRIPWQDDSITHAIGSFPEENPEMAHFLWSKDSSSLYAFHSFKDADPIEPGGESNAYSIVITEGATLEDDVTLACLEVADVPSIPIPSIGGKLSSAGAFLYLVDPDGNDTAIGIAYPGHWVAFYDIPSVAY